MSESVRNKIFLQLNCPPPLPLKKTSQWSFFLCCKKLNHMVTQQSHETAEKLLLHCLFSPWTSSCSFICKISLFINHSKGTCIQLNATQMAYYRRWYFPEKSLDYTVVSKQAPLPWLSNSISSNLSIFTSFRTWFCSLQSSQHFWWKRIVTINQNPYIHHKNMLRTTSPAPVQVSVRIM